MKILRSLLFVLLTIYLANGASIKRSEESRIVNGYVAKPGQFPYQALLRIFRRDRIGICGGCVISDEWILTAGHCIVQAIEFEVHLGVHRLDNESEIGRLIVKTNISILHNGYNAFFARDDIGLIRLLAKIRFTTRIRPAVLPSVVESFDGQEVIASGWGRTVAHVNELAEVLNWTPMHVINNAECVWTFPLQTRSTILCAQGENLQNVCSGDSGGPLTLRNSNILIGLTSFGHNQGCDAGHPSGFTRLTSYLAWIRSRTGIRSMYNVTES